MAYNDFGVYGTDDEEEDDAALPAAPLMPGLSAKDAFGAWQKAQSLVEQQNRNNLDMLRAAQEQIRQQRVGPSRSEQLLAIAATLGQPTRTGSFGETIGNVAGVMQKNAAAKRAAEEERAAMLSKYGMDIGNQQLRALTQSAGTAGQVYSRAAAAEAAMARAQAAANKPQRRRTAISPVDGRIYDLDTGAVIEPPSAELPTLTPEQVAEARRAGKHMRFRTVDGREMEI